MPLFLTENDVSQVLSTNVAIDAIEEAFNISMETDDIIDFSSYKKGMEILENKHNLKFD